MPAKPKTPRRAPSIALMSVSHARTLRAEGKSENTISSYGLSVRLFSEFLERRGRDLTIDVSKDDIRDFITEQRTTRSPATALVRFKSLQQFFRHCVEEGEIAASPMVGMRAPLVEREPPAIVPDDTLRKLLKVRSSTSLRDRRDSAFLRMFLDTGCRLAEVTNLRLSDFDFEGQRVFVRGKGNRVRPAAYGVKTAQAIDRYLRSLDAERPEVFDSKEDWFWAGRQGHMTTSGVDGVLKRMCADAGVAELHWHQLRHTFAHTWLANGGNEGDLMALAGWRSRKMLDHYGKSAQSERAHNAHQRLSLGDRV